MLLQHQVILFLKLFGSEGLDIMIPGSGIRFRNTVFADITGSGSVTLGYTG